MRSSIRRRIAIPYIVFVLLIMAALAYYLSGIVRSVHLNGIEDKLTTEARLLADIAQPYFATPLNPTELDSLARRWAELANARVTMIAADGAVLAESHADRQQMDEHLSRSEVQQALAQGQGSSIRYSDTLNADLMYVAVPIMTGPDVAGFVRLAVPLQEVEHNVARLQQIVLIGTVIAALLAGILAVVVAERTARPVRRLIRAAERMAEGDLNARSLPTRQDEVGQLTQAFNRMADRLQDQLASLIREQSRLNMILSNMADGVLILDRAGQVELINLAATRLLRISENGALQRTFAQVVRDHRLIELWKRACQQGEKQIEAVEIEQQRQLLRAFITPFQEGTHEGYLVILQDLTQIRRLETVRRDFVANISHELRTPLASLQALVDTLRDGALEDPPAARHFLDRMETEVDALTQMVQELLELSRIESGQVPLRLQSTPVGDMIIPPVERLRPQAERAGLNLFIEVPPDLPAVWVDATRVQHVVTNLVHNAIKFTPPGGSVTVRAHVQSSPSGPLGHMQESPDQSAGRISPRSPHRTTPMVVVEVADTGVGIPPEDLPRIFERFYKTDRARSSGGTGLGLAIAKHIVQAHHGQIWAESHESQGSTFHFSLPVVNSTFTNI